jgi:integrase
LRGDLAIARKAYEAKGGTDPYFLMPVNEEGKVLDMHALRHTTGAWLTIAGVSPKIVQEVMRHGNIKITFDTYGHLMPDDTKLANKHLAEMLKG